MRSRARSVKVEERLENGQGDGVEAKAENVDIDPY